MDKRWVVAFFFWLVKSRSIWLGSTPDLHAPLVVRDKHLKELLCFRRPYQKTVSSTSKDMYKVKWRVGIDVVEVIDGSLRPSTLVEREALHSDFIHLQQIGNVARLLSFPQLMVCAQIFNGNVRRIGSCTGFLTLAPTYPVFNKVLKQQPLAVTLSLIFSITFWNFWYPVKRFCKKWRFYGSSFWTSVAASAFRYVWLSPPWLASHPACELDRSVLSSTWVNDATSHGAGAMRTTLKICF